MRRVLCVLLVACESPVLPPRPAPTFVIAPNDAGAFHFGAQREVVAAAGPRRLSRGRHGHSIELVATDGVAAVSIDDARFARLWPSLDGRREPWALPLSQPMQVAVESGNGFGVAAIDSAGNLEVLAVDDSGLLTSHVQVESDGFESVVAVDHGFVAIRRDQVIEKIDRSGARRGSLVGHAGERIVRTLRASADRLLLLVNNREGTRGRWLDVGDALVWGSTTPVLAIDPATAFLSPDHVRLVGVRPPHADEDEFEPPKRILVDLRTGRSSKLGSHLIGDFSLPIGFASAGEVVLALPELEASQLEWVDLEGTPSVILGGTKYDLESVAVDRAIVVGNRIVSFSNRDLVTVTREKVTYLGYRQESARLVATPSNVVVGAGGPALLDEALHATRRLPSSSAAIVDTNLALVHYGGVNPDWLDLVKSLDFKPRRDELPRIALYDLARKREVQSVLTSRNADVAYEPTTNIIAIKRGAKLSLSRVEAKRLAAPIKFALPATKVALLDPALANGGVMVTVHGRDVRAWTQHDVDAQTPPAATTVDGTVEAIDRAGRLYIRSGDAITIGEARITERQIRPSPDGKLVAAFTRDRVRLLDDRGAERWVIALPGVTDVQWSPRGELLVVARDLAHLSLTDGSIVVAQCGWVFGRHAEHAVHDNSGSTLCDR